MAPCRPAKIIQPSTIPHPSETGIGGVGNKKVTSNVITGTSDCMERQVFLADDNR